MKNLQHHSILWIVIFFCCCNNLPANAQVAIRWEQCFSAYNYWYEELVAIQPTPEGGYIAAFQTGIPLEGNQFGLMKIDASLNVMWIRNYGGSASDQIDEMILSAEGGYLLIGKTYSNDGDITNYYGGQGDAWVVKTDTAGNLLWQKSFGGSDTDVFYSAVQDPAGNYVATGQTSSSDFDLTGLNPTGGSNMWVVKFDTGGTILDQQLLRYGNGGEIINTSDGGYAIAGLGSNLNGCCDFDTSYGLQDFGVARLDSSLNKIWARTFGGNGADLAWNLIETSDGNFVVSGWTGSNNNGDVIGAHGSGDFWVIKLDSAGNMIWQRCLGGLTQEQDKPDIIETGSGNYIIAGSFFDSSVLNDSIAIQYGGGGDIWLAALDPAGTWLWEKTFGGGGYDFSRNIEKISDHDFIITGVSSSHDYDVTGNCGNAFLWMASIFDEPNSVTGKVFADVNSNGMMDVSEYAVPFHRITETGSARQCLSDDNGFYRLDMASPGTYEYQADTLMYYQSLPAFYTKTFTGTNETDSLFDFAFQPTGNFNDLKAEFSFVTDIRPGFQSSCLITITNIGTTSVTGNAVMVFDPFFTLLNASALPSFFSTDSLVWDLINVQPFQSVTILVEFQNSITMPANPVFVTTITALPIAGDANPSDNIFVSEDIGVWSFDPNDIAVNNDTIYINPGPSPSALDYTVRFQNTGTAPAVFVSITTSVPDNIDFNSFELISSSHPVDVTLFPHSRNIQFYFDSIMLPYSAVDFLASNGFVKYRFAAPANPVHGDSVPAKANIYFDFNPVITTNSVTTRIIACDEMTTLIPITSVTCFGDSVLLHASGLVSGANYTWFIDSVFYSNQLNTAIATAVPGIHQVELVTENNFCSLSLQSQFEIAPVPVIALPLDTINCAPQIVLEATPGYQSYLWSNGDTTVSTTITIPGIYAVTVTDINGCSSSDTVQVSFYSLPVVSLGGDTTVCGALTLNAGTGFSTYSWSDGTAGPDLTVTVSDVYSVTVSDSNGCTAIDSVIVAVLPLPVVTLDVWPSDTICLNEGIITLNSGTPPAGILGGNGLNGFNFDPQAAVTGWNIFSYGYLDSTGCYNYATDSLFVDACLYIPGNNTNPRLTFYPNPANNHLIIQLPAEGLTVPKITITDLSGRIIDYTPVTTDRFDIIKLDIKHLSEGMYLLHINDKGIHWVAQFVKMQE